MLSCPARLARALANGDENVIKFTEAALRENSLRPDPRSPAANQQRHADAPVHVLEREHQVIAHKRYTGVNGRGLRLDGSARAYMVCLRCMWGSVSTAHRPATREAWQWEAEVSWTAARI